MYKQQFADCLIVGYIWVSSMTACCVNVMLWLWWVRTVSDGTGTDLPGDTVHCTKSERCHKSKMSTRRHLQTRLVVDIFCVAGDFIYLAASVKTAPLCHQDLCLLELVSFQYRKSDRTCHTHTHAHTNMIYKLRAPVCSLPAGCECGP